MYIAEHKLNLFRQIDELPEEFLLELEKIISQLQVNKKRIEAGIVRLYERVSGLYSR